MHAATPRFARSCRAARSGYDALDNDPLAGLTLHPNDFGTSVRAIVHEAGFPRERIALGLEGGYDLDSYAGMPGGLARTCEALVSEFAEC